MDCDVLIVGAGPAGTAAAFDLLGQGLSVLILDKYDFPRKKACAGGITPKGLQVYRYDISSQVRQICHSIRIRSSASASFDIRTTRPLCHMTDRRELDLFSLDKAVSKGAQFKVARRILSIEEKPARVEVRTETGTFTAGFVIGADGANSIVRRFITKKKFFRKQMALEADVRVSGGRAYEMEFDFSRNRNGYYWIFPKRGHVNIGIYSTDPGYRPGISDLAAFAGHRLGNMKLEAVKGYPICTGGAAYRPDMDRILLAGDAAGTAEPLFGEGIYFALKSGQLAAAAVSAHFSEPGAVRAAYRSSLRPLQKDLKLYDLSAAFFYRFPRFSMTAASLPAVKTRFARGFASGLPLARMILGRFG